MEEVEVQNRYGYIDVDNEQVRTLMEKIEEQNRCNYKDINNFLEV